MSLHDLAAAVRRSGLNVVELRGWQHRGRPGSFNPRGVLCHHTGGTSGGRGYAEWMALTGRPDLPAPLCQLALDRDGTVYVSAAGRANHAGTARASGPLPGGDGNTLYIGVEAMNNGSEGWTRAQYDAYVRLCAALCVHYGWPATHVRAHKETSTSGKWDPGLMDMGRFRKDVAALMRGGLGVEDDMPTPAEFWNHKDPNGEPMWLINRRGRDRAAAAENAARVAVQGIQDLAQLVGNTRLSAKDKDDLVERVAKRTAEAVERLDAASVADRLQVSVKDGDA